MRVLDLTWVLSGPYAAMTLCDLGAEVIKVERPPYGDIARTTGPFLGEESAYFISINRGKRSVALDLRTPEGKDAFLRLVEQVDVVMENFTPGVMAKLGLDYETLAARNQRLIMCSVSGFGQTGPDRDLPALDIIVQGMGGVMSITGEPGGRPVRPGLSLGDIAAGLYAAIAVLAALHERERSGRGQYVDVSMLDCQLAVLENAYTRYFVTGEAPQPLGTRHPAATPFQAFPTTDGYVVIALSWGTENQWQLLCGILGVTELIDDERFETSGQRTANHAELEPILSAAFQQRSTADWLEDLRAAKIPSGSLNTIPRAATLPQVEARGMIVEVEHPKLGPVRLINHPLKFSRTPAAIQGPPPSVGQDTRHILREVGGLDEATIDRLVAAGIALETDPATAPAIPH
ncbi:MAG: CaiB/BaiF CoA transferase family protein [Dehalococcoidia bacterium]